MWPCGSLGALSMLGPVSVCVRDMSSLACGERYFENCMSNAEYKADVAGTADMTSPYVVP